MPLVGETGSALVTCLGGRDLYVWTTPVADPLTDVAEPGMRAGDVAGVVVYAGEQRGVWRAGGVDLWVEAGPTSHALPALGPLVAASGEFASAAAGG